MKFWTNSVSRRKSTPLARGLACVLLIGIIYGVTFGSAHSHLNSSAALYLNKIGSPAGNVGSVSAILRHDREKANDCLICVFQQQLSNSFVHAQLLFAAPSPQTSLPSVPADFHYSHPAVTKAIARLSGRAPPVELG